MVLMLCAFALAQPPAKDAPTRGPDVIFVPTPHEVVAEMLRLAEVDAKDTVYDLGCGDGRLVITAAKKYGAHGVGIDIDPERIKESKANAVKEGVTDHVKFIQADLFTSDISGATAVTLYLLTTLNEKLRPKLLAELKPGTPIVSHDFNMGDWQPEQTIHVQGPSRLHTVYRWTVPAKAAGVWEWKQGADRVRMSVRQNYSDVEVSMSRDGKELTVKDAKLSGRELRVAVDDGSGTHNVRAIIRGADMDITENGRRVATAHRQKEEAVSASRK
jgi:SAM-dependent methyltransferase